MSKRVFDILLSIVGLIILSPVFFVLSLAIKLDSPGPVFYRGIRIGRYGKPFKIYKFRSMILEAEKIGAIAASNSDSRVTRVGKFIRKFKFDELSQLINVLLGDMSLVGPRPEVKRFVDLYDEEERLILTVRPGITDWSSLKFHDQGKIIEASCMADTDEAFLKLIRPEKVRLQLKYVRERSFWSDINIIFATVMTIVSTRFREKTLHSLVPKE